MTKTHAIHQWIVKVCNHYECKPVFRLNNDTMVWYGYDYLTRKGRNFPSEKNAFCLWEEWGWHFIWTSPTRPLWTSSWIPVWTKSMQILLSLLSSSSGWYKRIFVCFYLQYMSIASKNTYNENYLLLFIRNPQVRSQSIVSSLWLALPLWHRCFFQAYKVDYNLFFGTSMQRAPI